MWKCDNIDIFILRDLTSIFRNDFNNDCFLLHTNIVLGNKYFTLRTNIFWKINVDFVVHIFS